MVFIFLYRRPLCGGIRGFPYRKTHLDHQGDVAVDPILLPFGIDWKSTGKKQIALLCLDADSRYMDEHFSVILYPQRPPNAL
jgi:hypothetical protein